MLGRERNKTRCNGNFFFYTNLCTGLSLQYLLNYLQQQVHLSRQQSAYPPRNEKHRPQNTQRQHPGHLLVSQLLSLPQHARSSSDPPGESQLKLQHAAIQIHFFQHPSTSPRPCVAPMELIFPLARLLSSSLCRAKQLKFKRICCFLEHANFDFDHSRKTRLVSVPIW